MITSCAIWGGTHRTLFSDVIESEIDRDSMEVYTYLKGDVERQAANGLLIDGGGFSEDIKYAVLWYAEDLNAEGMVNLLNQVAEMESETKLWLVYPSVGLVPKSVAAFATEGPYDADPPKNNSAQWITQWFEGRGVAITSDGAETLASYVSGDLEQLTRILVSLRELDEEITEDHVYEMVDKLGMRGFFDLPNFVLGGNRAEAMEALKRASTEPPIKLLSILTDKMRMAIVLSYDRNADLEAFGVSEKAAYMIRKTSPRLTPELCAAASKAISSTDHALKGGLSSEMGFVALESCVDTLTAICGQAKRGSRG